MIKTLKLSKTRCYILSLPSGLLLIDTGYYKDKKQFFQELERQDISLSSIKYLFLTHHHDDHSGLLNNIVTKNPDIIVILNKECKKLLEKGVNSRDFGGYWCSKKMKIAADFYRIIDKSWTLSFPPYFARNTDIVLPSEDFELEQFVSRKLKAIYSPGHSIDSISLLDEHMNLFCGDAAADYLRILGTKYAPPFITDLSQFYQTWQKFIDLGVKLIYPSHGKPIQIEIIKQNINKLTNNDLVEFTWN